MAGKVQLSKFPLGYKYDISDVPYVKHTPPSSGWNMEEDVVLDQLSDQSFKKRAEILEYLITSARRNGGRLPYSDVHSIYQGLEHALSDSNWDVRLKCVQLINETIPHIEDVDSCMSLVLPQLVPNLGDSKITIRRAVIQSLHVYMKNTRNIQSLFRSVIKYGLECDHRRVRKEAMIALPLLFTAEFANEDFYEVSLSLAKKLQDNGEDSLRDTAIFTMEKIRNLVGDRDFNSYIQKFPPEQRHCYLNLSTRIDENNFRFENSSKITESPSLSSRSNMPFLLQSQERYRNETEEHYEFGIIPSQVMQQIYDHGNFKTRALAVEELKNILNDLYRLDLLKPHILSFISFLSSLLDDDNFKITIVTLDILYILAYKLEQDVKNYLRPLVSALTKRMSDNKIVVRQSIMKVSMQLMQSYSPKPVLSVICENLQHRNSKVRQEALNIVIGSLLKFPSNDFDLPELCEVIGPSLLDYKRPVRQAALECYAVLAQAMGNGKLRPLAKAVDQIEVNSPGAEGVMAAVQARLSRRQLPKIGLDGLVELATPLTGVNRAGMLQGPDIDWVMAASGGGSGSARTSRTEAVELESVSSRTSSAVSRDGSTRPVPAPRRIVSAGRGKNKLPWEDSTDDWGKTYESMPGTAPARGGRSNPDAPPIQPRMTWGGEETIQDGKRGPRIEDTSSSGNMSTGSQRITKVKRIGMVHHGGYEDDFNHRDSGWESHRHIKTKLEPILVKDGVPTEETPIPLKPTLARGSAKLRNKVPPIIPSSDRTPRDLIDDDLDSAYAPSLGSTADRDNQAEMMSSLRRIRNSASKKKAAKIFEKLEKEQSRQSMVSGSPSPPPSNVTPFESGFYSPASTRDDWSDWSSRESSLRGGKRSDYVFDAKSKSSITKDARSHADNRGNYEDERGYKQDISHQIEFNPMSGVTFRGNKSSDVKIVGRGYGEETSTIDNKLPGPNKARDRRRLTNTKGSTLSPLGVASLHGFGALDLDDLLMSHRGKIGVVGRGMFDTAPITSDQSANSSAYSDRLEKKQNKQTRNYPTGIYGIGVRQNSSDRPEAEGSPDETEDYEEEPLNMSMSKSTKERMVQKKQQRQDEVDKKLKDKEDRKEKERQLESFRLSDKDSDSEAPVDLSEHLLWGEGMGARCSSQVETSIRQPSVRTRDIEERQTKSTLQNVELHPRRSQKEDQIFRRQIEEKQQKDHGRQIKHRHEVKANYPAEKSQSNHHDINPRKGRVRKNSLPTQEHRKPTKIQPLQPQVHPKDRSEQPKLHKRLKDGAEKQGVVSYEETVINHEDKDRTRQKTRDQRTGTRNQSHNVETSEKGESTHVEKSDRNQNVPSDKIIYSQQPGYQQEIEEVPLPKRRHRQSTRKLSVSLLDLSHPVGSENGIKHSSLGSEVFEISVQPIKADNFLCGFEKHKSPVNIKHDDISVPQTSNDVRSEHKPGQKQNSSNSSEVSIRQSPFVSPSQSKRRQSYQISLDSATSTSVVTNEDEIGKSKPSVANLQSYYGSKIPASSNPEVVLGQNSRQGDLYDLQTSSVLPTSIDSRPKYQPLYLTKAESYNDQNLYDTQDLMVNDFSSDSDVDLKQYPKTNTALAVSGNSSTPSKYTSTFPPHTLSPRKKSKTGSQTIATDKPSLPVSASTKSVVTSENPDDWEPFRDAEAALREAQKSMAQADWEAKCNGINIIRRLCKYHCEVLALNLHAVIIALIAEVKNLRSQVSRLAVVCFGDLFQALRSKMDPDLDVTIKALLAKNGESNGFIRDDVDRALSLMVDNSTPQRALIALIGGGAGHKNSAVRKTAALFLVDVVERMGPGKILSGVKDITDKVIPTVAQFTMDTSPETRYNGRKILFMLMNHQDFGRMLSKHLPTNTLKSVSDIVENLRTKGLGDVPSESMSARSRRSGQGSRSSSFRGGSAASSSMSGAVDSTKRRVVRTDDKTQDEIKQIMSLLTANDWRDRYRGLDEFLQMCETNTNIVGHQIVKIFDKFLPRLQDSNSKVNLRALQVMLLIIPLLKDSFSSVINLTVQNVSPNLNSKNMDIKQLATNILDMLLDQLDGTVLIQPFANQAQSASSRSQPDMIEKVAYLVSKIYGKKQKQVVLHVLPLLWGLLGVNTRGVTSGTSPVRTATVNLVHSLYDYMGDTLLDHAQSNPSVSSKHIELLQDLIDE